MNLEASAAANLALPRSTAIGSALGRIAYLALCALAAVLPWGESLSLTGGLIATYLGVLAFGIAAMRTLVIRRTRRLSPLHYWMLAYVGWISLSILWTVDWNSSTTRILTFLQLLAFVWLIWELVATEALVRGLLLSYVVGALIASSMTLYNFIAGETAAQLTQGSVVVGGMVVEKWDTLRYSVYGLNENDLGLMLAMSIPMLFYLLVSCKGPLVKLLCWLELVAGITAILLTGSRGGLIAATVGLAMFPLILFRLPRWQRFASLAASGGLLVSLPYLVPPTTWSRILGLGSEISSGTLSHRTEIWAAGLAAFRDHALLGVGAGAYGPSILRVVDLPLVAHNTFLSVLVELGVVGALLLFALLASIFYCAVRMRYLERCLWITLLLTWTIGVSMLTWEYTKPTWLLFGLVAAHVYSRRIARPRPKRPINAAAAFSGKMRRLRPRPRLQTLGLSEGL